MTFYMAHSCCSYKPPAPKTIEEAQEQIFTHQREYHQDDPWVPCKITLVEDKDEDGDDSSR